MRFNFLSTRFRSPISVEDGNGGARTKALAETSAVSMGALRLLTRSEREESLQRRSLGEVRVR